MEVGAGGRGVRRGGGGGGRKKKRKTCLKESRHRNTFVSLKPRLQVPSERERKRK